MTLLSTSNMTATRRAAMELANGHAYNMRDTIWQALRTKSPQDVEYGMNRLLGAIRALGVANIAGSAEEALAHSAELASLAGVARDCKQIIDKEGRIAALLSEAADFLAVTSAGAGRPDVAVPPHTPPSRAMRAEARFEHWRMKNFPDVDAAAMRAAFWVAHWEGRQESDAIWADVCEDRLSEERQENNRLREVIAELEAARAVRQA